MSFKCNDLKFFLILHYYYKQHSLRKKNSLTNLKKYITKIYYRIDGVQINFTNPRVYKIVKHIVMLSYELVWAVSLYKNIRGS